MSDDTVKMDLRLLDKFIRTLRAKPPEGRIGILGDSPRKEGNAGNAEIGAKYEFKTNADTAGGSFLRVPITDHLSKELQKSGALDKAVMEDVIKQGTVVPWLKKVMIVAEGIVQGAFDTGGYGKWKESNMTFKKNHQTLVETGQLRNSITSEVKE